MKPKFEIGDRVRYNELEAVVVGVDAESKRYSIQYEDDDDKYCVKEDWIEFANPRAAFLTRLQELLARLMRALRPQAREQIRLRLIYISTTSN